MWLRPVAYALAAYLAGAQRPIVRNAREGDAFTYLFQWRYSRVAQECEEVLGPHGYRAVCVDPPNEHLPGKNWYWRYQPVSYKLDSRGGSEAEFIDMVDRCHKAGVDVYVDLLLNHMANAHTPRGTTGIAGTKFGDRNFSGLYAPEDFHHKPGDVTSNCRFNSLSRRVVQECDLLGLPDLDTGSASVRARLTAFVQRLSDVGVDGIRVDASRHIPAGELASILEPVTGRMTFAMMEHVMDMGCSVEPSEYFLAAPGGVAGESRHMEFEGAAAVGLAFRTGDLASLRNFGGRSRGLVPSDKAVTFTDNHDLQRHAFNIREGYCRGCGGLKHCLGGCIHFAVHALSFHDGALHTLGNAFLLAHPYGYPCVMSSYNFSRAGDGPPEGDEPCGGAWVCEHRQATLRSMLRFRRATAGAPLAAFEAPDGGWRMAFAREGVGYFALNLRRHPWRPLGLRTLLPEGVYTDLAGGGEVNVCKGGLADLNVPARGFIAVIGPAASSRVPRCERPRPSPSPAPSRAACSLHERCRGLAGDCCPHRSGTMLACCRPLAEVQANATTRSQAAAAPSAMARRRRRSPPVDDQAYGVQDLVVDA